MSVIPEKIIYGWNQYERDMKFAVSKLSPYRGRLKNIYGLPRGGLIIAVTLSHSLGLPIILNEADITEETLIVDDIADSGETLENLKLMDRNISFTLHYNNKSKFKPTVWIVKKNGWIQYPWETKESSKYDNR